MDDIFQEIAEEVEEEMALDSTGHDMHHLLRVYRMGMKIVDAEGGDWEVVGAACLTHDIHRVMGDGEFVSPSESLPRVREVLEAAEFPEEKIEEVLHCVEVHEEYSFEEGPGSASTLEADIVQDADNLDALGAIGIGRAFMFSGSHGNPMWRPEREVEGKYDKTELDKSTVYHFHDKVLNLKDNMNTETAKEIAEDRHAFIEEFVERFKKEWKGEI